MYADLHTHSAFTFRDGASSPEDLIQAASDAGQTTMALTDRDGIYGIVRFHEAAKRLGIKAIVGAELTLAGGYALPLIVLDGEGYAPVDEQRFAQIESGEFLIA